MVIRELLPIETLAPTRPTTGSGGTLWEAGAMTDVVSTTADLLQRAGVDPTLAAEVTFTGPETVLPSAYRVTEASQCLVAAFSVALAVLDRQRSTGSRIGTGHPSIVVDAEESAAAFQSERHLRLDGPAELWDGLAGHYEAADGHIQFHTNFTHHRSALLRATECGDDASREQVAEIVAGVDRFEMENRVMAAGGIAAALRSVDEWHRHPHHEHVVGRPPLMMTRATDATQPHRWARSAGVRPLEGLRVLDLTRVIAGPVASRALAAYGADVLRLGAPDLPVVTSILPDTTLGKRFAHCNITTAQGRDTALRLASEADVVVTGFRPGALSGRGLGPDDLLDANPNLIHATLSAFGSDGPWGGRRGFDSITQTATGIVATETEAYHSPTPRSLPCQLLDHGTGFLLALGILGGLIERERSGGGHLIEASLLTTRYWLEGLGPADPTAGGHLDDATITRYSRTRPSGYGPVTHIRHPGSVDGLPASWDTGPSTPGQHQPVWLPR